MSTIRSVPTDPGLAMIAGTNADRIARRAMREFNPFDPSRALGERLVAMLVPAILLLSVGDLLMTLEMVTRLGMVEMNPLARAVMSYGNPLILAIWKLATAGLACWILYRARTHRVAQVGAWVGFFALAWLTVHWGAYITEVSVHVCIDDWRANAHDTRWVAMAP